MDNIKFIDGRINQEHADLEILAKNCECENFLRNSSGLHNNHKYEGHYFRVKYLRNWENPLIDALQNSFNKTNEQTNEHKFELIDVTDWEMEWDKDRYWEASFTFLAHKK